jgi:hypothetical protein
VYRDILSPRQQENADLVFDERAPSELCPYGLTASEKFT